MRTHIKSNLNKTLKTEVNHKKTHTELDFKKWTTALKLLDDDRINEERKILEMITKQRASHLETHRDFTRPLANPSRAANIPSFNCTAPKPSTSATPAVFVCLPHSLPTNKTSWPPITGVTSAVAFLFTTTPQNVISITPMLPCTKPLPRLMSPPLKTMKRRNRSLQSCRWT